MHADKTITQTTFMVLFTYGSFPHLGRPLDASSGVSPGYLSTTSSPPTVLSHYRYNPMDEFQFFSKDQFQWGKDYTDLRGHLDICSLLDQLPLVSLTLPEISSFISLRVWGDTEKPCSDMAYLLVSAKDEAMSDRVHGLTTMWVDPSQARVSTVEESVRQLTALVSSGPNWSYALVQLNKNTHHAPLPREGPLGILTEGDTNSTTCSQIGQLEVCQLLSSGLQVIYPVGLNRHETPMIDLPPESLAKGTTLTGGKPTYLKASIPQPTPEEQEPKAPLHSSHFSSIQVPSPIKAPPPKVEREVSMMKEVRELLSMAVLDMSGHMSGNSNPKRLNPMVMLMPLSPNWEIFLVQWTHLPR